MAILLAFTSVCRQKKHHIMCHIKYAAIHVVFVFSMLTLGCLLMISDLVVANLFMHSLPGIILLYLTATFYTNVFLHEIVTT